VTAREAILIGGMALVTFAVRYPVLAVLGRIELPQPLFRALRFVPPAVLTAIIVPGVLMPGGALALRADNAYLVAGVISAAVAVWRKNLLLTIVVGMAVFLGWRLLIGGM
jgi:branched-subunit amino acid transport protein